MAVPFPSLPDADVLRPDEGADVDPHASLMALGYHHVGESIDPADVAARVATTDETDTGGPPHWRITSDDVAEWAMARLAEARANRAALRRQRDNYVARIEDWHQRAGAEVERTAAFFEGHLVLWGYETRAFSGGEVKTTKLPSGEIRTRKPGPWRPAIEDPAALLEWALDLRDRGTNIVRSRLILDVMAAALAQVAVAVAADEGPDGGEMIVVDAETGERIPGTVARRTEPAPTVVTYETD